MDNGNDEREAAFDEISLELADVDRLVLDVRRFRRRAQLVSVKEVLRKVGFFELCKAKLGGMVFDDQTRSALGNQVAEPRPASLVWGKGDDGAREEGHTLDGVVKSGVKIANDSAPIVLFREGEA